MPGNQGNRMRAPRGQGRNMGSMPGRSANTNYGDNRMAASSGGPLMTNHLELHDLDLELALLKRKREMIEKQHNMLVSESRIGGPSQYGFQSQPVQSYGQQSEPTRSFANLYNDPPAPEYNRFNAQQGLKRPAINPWDTSAPKRFSGPTGPKRTHSRYEPRPGPRSQPASQPPPLMATNFNRRPPARSTFRPTKVSKPRQTPAPNKLDTYPIPERKKLVAKASDLVEAKTQPQPQVLVLENGRPTNSKLLGRLELALGTILRLMREAHGEAAPYADVFTSISGQRALKRTIRERIHSMMVGKPVGTGPEIVTLYRERHPESTDLEFLEQARESTLQPNGVAIEIVQAGHPEKYFKINFRRLLDRSLTQMFGMLQTIHEKMQDSKESYQGIIDSMLIDMEKQLRDENYEPVIEVRENAGTEKKEDAGTEKKENAEMAENGDKESGAQSVDTKVNDTEKEKEEPEEQKETAATKDNAAKAEDAEKTEGAAKTAKDTDKNKQAETVEPTRKREELIRAKFYCRIMETLLRRNLPAVLPRYRDVIYKMFNAEQGFKETKAYLIKTTNEKVENNQEAETAPSANLNSGTPEKKGSLFVRIMGRPGLPNKKKMKAFLDTFHPSLIKKHRNVHNILFVSFSKREDFDNILAKNGTVLSNCKLDIKVSERLNKNTQAGKTTENNAEINAEPHSNNEKNAADDDVQIVEPQTDTIKLDESLNNEIDELLMSIREGEEQIGQIEASEENEVEEIKEGNDVENDATEAQDSVADGMDTEADESEKPAEEIEQPQKEEPQATQKDVDAVKTDANPPATPTRTSMRTRRASKLT